MHLEQLEFIVEVAKTGSLTRAAQNRHVTLSAVSQSISNLEGELGVTLFTRSRNGAVVTAEGQAIIRKAVEVLSKLQELKQEANLYSDMQSGELRIASIPGPLSLLVNTIVSFKRDYSQIQMDITEKGSSEIIEDIQHNRADIGLVILFESLLSKHPSLSFGRLLEGKLVVAVSKKSPLALYPSLSPEELLFQPVVLYKDDYLKWFIDQFEASYGRLNTLFYTNNTVAIQKAVSENLAVTVGLDFSFNNRSSSDKDTVTIKLDLPDQPSVYLGWISPEDKKLPKASRLFINKLQYEFDKY
ncbi:LysR family transcriptional regulator [Cohnella abietis]|uniref:LysR family transcriptional regulator n=1 Tax=Cohnella abietis TaxID=2507935 RepID=A0A3T1DED9_9BACL|nr:LysR family transcriptional regulator [Cohnella abietis]BBI36453.1 LysR family transcriptional regulator [Cohnella abietis]